MSKRNVYITAALVILILGGLLFFFYSFINKGATPTPEKSASLQNNLFPYGTGSEGTATSSAQNASSSGYVVEQSGETPTVRQISVVPTAGAIAFRIASSTKIRYTERGTGRIYETTADSLSQIRVSNVTVPKIYEARWGSGNSFVIRYLDSDEATIESYAGLVIPVKNIATTTQFTDVIPTTVTGKFLPQDISEITSSPKGDKLFYLEKNNGGSFGVIVRNDGTNPVQIFDSPFGEWIPQWLSDASILITTKASSDSLGYSYFLNTTNGVLTPALEGVRGLITLSNSSGNTVVYSDSSGGSWTFNMYTVKSGSSEPTLLKTFPEKCVWGRSVTTDLYCANPTFSPIGTYPDDWYKGKVHFSDDIWKLDTITGVLTQIAKLKAISGQDIDAINLSLDEKDSYLIFINKNDLTLWGLKLK